MKHTLKIMTVAMILGMAFSHKANAGQCQDGSESDYCCNVITAGSGHGSLKEHIKAFNFGSKPSEKPYASWGACRELIDFKINQISAIHVVIDEPLELIYENSASSNSLVIDGAGVTLESALANEDDSMFVINGTNQVTLTNMTIVGNGNPFVTCKNGVSLTLTGITIQNEPQTAIKIEEGCTNVTIDGIKVYGSTTLANNDISRAGSIISVTGGDADNGIENVVINDVTFSESSKGTGISINYATNVTVTGIKGYNHKGALVSLQHINNLSKLEVYGENVDAGVYMNYVFENDGDSPEISLDLTGNPNLSNLNNAKAGGAGLYLDQEIVGMDFSGIQISNFSGNAIEVHDSSNYNKFTGVKVFSNGNYGLLLADLTSSNEIIDSTFTNNGNCGIFLSSSQKNMLKGINQMANNGSGCAIGTSNLNLADNAVSVLATGFDEILVTMNREEVANDIYLELHYSAAQIVDDGGETTPGLTTGRTSKKNKLSTARLTPTQISQKVLANSLAISSTAITGISLGNNTSGQNKTGDGSDIFSNESYIHQFVTEELPEEYSVDSVEYDFVAIVKNADGFVLGIWTGPAATKGNYASDPNCFLEPTTQQLSRLYDISNPLDQDGDGLNDDVEDADMDCYPDTNETNPYKADTDGDLVRDYEEVFGGAGSNANLADSDGDGLNDGEEDKNHNGAWDDSSGESNPMDTDTDDDGLGDGQEVSYGTDPTNTDSDGDSSIDGDDKCPMQPGSEKCYYDFCVPKEGVAVDAAISDGVENAGNTQICDDQDGDGVCSQVEDLNGNCAYDPGLEMDASNKDTDNDGLTDGNEDTDWNGTYDPDRSETNPLSQDTDGDCIPDGKEAKSGSGAPFDVSEQSKETDPTRFDSDGDGMGDGEEDFDCDGVNDEGETKPWLADTDGDSVNDDTDICPWNINQSCVVRYCNINGFEQIDTDGDSLPDVEEDFDGNCAWTKSEREPNPLTPDTDEDGLNDSTEVECFKTNPIAADSDGDGRNDYSEVQNSIDQCQALYNMGDTNPLRAEFGGCGLRTEGHATSSELLPIIGMMVLALVAGLRMKTRVTNK